MNLPELEQLVRRFTALELSRAAWTHEAHLLVGLWHVSRYGADGAMTRLREGIRRLNESNGVANTPTGGYHETVTRAYVELLAQFDAARQETGLQQRASQLLEHPLAQRDVLLRFYSRERLMSAEARQGWCEPDLGPLQLAALEAVPITG